MTENGIAKQILDAFAVHSKLGPRLLESVYEVVLAYELQKRGLIAERQKPMPIMYDDIRFEEGFRADIVVNGKVNAELKSSGGTASGTWEAGSHPAAVERIKARPSHQLR